MRIWSNYHYFNKSTGLFVKQSDWDKKSLRVRGTGADANSINAQLESLKHKVIQITNQLISRGRPSNVEMIRKILDGEEENQMTLLKVFDEHLKMIASLFFKLTLASASILILIVQGYLKPICIFINFRSAKSFYK